MRDFYLHSQAGPFVSGTVIYESKKAAGVDSRSFFALSAYCIGERTNRFDGNMHHVAGL